MHSDYQGWMVNVRCKKGAVNKPVDQDEVLHKFSHILRNNSMRNLASSHQGNFQTLRTKFENKGGPVPKPV
ncbi:unnamed protein product [Caenorhabditis brenneri]